MPARASITVVIATFNRPATLPNSVRCVLAQLTETDELLVVDQTADYDPTVEGELRTLLADSRSRWVRGGPPSLPAARNFGLAEAQGEIVVFVDDDIELLDGFLEAHRRTFSSPKVIASTGRVARPGATAPTDDSPPSLRLGGWIRGSANSGIPGETNALYGCNMAMRKTAALEAGGFDRRYIGNAFREDADIAWRLRVLGSIAYAPSAALIHLEEKSGGCKGPRSLRTEALLFQNETYFFRKNYNALLLPVWLASILRRSVLCGPAFRERRVLRSAAAFLLGLAGAFRGVTPSPEFAPFSK
jgi:GT2 family glycosyltransferase